MKKAIEYKHSFVLAMGQTAMEVLAVTALSVLALGSLDAQCMHEQAKVHLDLSLVQVSNVVLCQPLLLLHVAWCSVDACTPLALMLLVINALKVSFYAQKRWHYVDEEGYWKSFNSTQHDGGDDKKRRKVCHIFLLFHTRGLMS